MPVVDDFDVVRDDEGDGPPRSYWLWVAVTAVIALFAFAVGAAFVILNSRLAPAAPTRPASTPTVAAAAAIAPTSTPLPTVSATSTLTPAQTSTPAPTPTAFCSIPVDGIFASMYDQKELGCAITASGTVWAAWQSFEGGNMLWRSDTDGSYVLYANQTWFPVDESWDGVQPAGRGDPPPGLEAPVRGFGFVWSNRDDIYRGLGWATGSEKGFCAFIQDFERGFMLRSNRVASCTDENLYNNASAPDFSPLALIANESGRWRSQDSPPVADAQPPASAQPPGAVTRPAQQQIYAAPRLDGVVLDGQLDEWTGDWLPLSAIVLGEEYHTGPGDLSGSFQVAWNSTGLLFAVRVNDATSRPGPIGSDQWRGDSLEIQFDRLLAEDFADTTASLDDYQIGVGFDTDSTALRGYRWLPAVLEGSIEIPGTFVPAQSGYAVEFVVPWHLLELSVTTLTPEHAFGFTLTVDDNDGDAFAQETALSTSPARTTHDNPTQWSTLRLLP